MSKFSNGHYEAIAKVVSELSVSSSLSRIDHEMWAFRYYTIRLADMLEEDNPKFDRDRFFKACGEIMVMIGLK